MKFKVLILSFTDTRTDPRVHRQLDALRDECDVTTAGVCPGNNFNTTHIVLNRSRRGKLFKVLRLMRLLFRRYMTVYWDDITIKDAYIKCNAGYDLIICNDMETVPLCVKLCQMNKSRLFVDLHEYQPLQFDDQVSFRLFIKPYWDYLCREYLPAADVVTTVCESIAREYLSQYGIEADVIFNAPKYADLPVSMIDPENIKIIHHGGINRSRKLELMISLMDRLDERFSLYLMLVESDARYYRELEVLADKNPRVHMIPPVEMIKIVDEINTYDIGLYMLPDSNFNIEHALPNKIFEFLQAKLAILTWPSVEMANLVRSTQTGLVTEHRSTKEMADLINGLTPEKIMEFKKNARIASRIYNSENSKEKIKELVFKLLI